MRKQSYMQKAAVVATMVCCTTQATHYKMPSKSVRAPESLGHVKLIHHDKKGFALFADGKKHEIDSSSIDPELHSVTNKQLKSFSQSGYISVHPYSDGSFGVKKNVRGNGGGIFTGLALYAAAKATQFVYSVAYPTVFNNPGISPIVDAGAKAAFVAGLVSPLP